MEMVFGLLIAGGVGYWVRSDAKALEEEGLRVGAFGPDGWFAGVFLLLIVFLPLYLVQRNRVLHPSSRLPPRGWIPDPSDPTQYRWWDGSKWTDDRAPIDPADRPRPRSPGPDPTA